MPVPPQAARILGQISTPLPVGRKAGNLQDGFSMEDSFKLYCPRFVCIVNCRAE